MEQELFTEQLRELEARIEKAELREMNENDENSNWFRKLPPTKKMILERKGVWGIVKRDIERKIELINKSLKTVSGEEEKREFYSLLNKFSSKLSYVEEKIVKLDSTLNDIEEKRKELEKQNKNSFAFLIVFFLVIGAMLVYGEYKKNNDKNSIKNFFNSN